jgi:hypothetical protein
MDMEIDERVRAAHVDHFCPGGAGFLVASPNAAGVDLEDADFVRRSWVQCEDHQAHAVGEICGRCHLALELADDARRRADGIWVHETCPFAA